MNKPTVTVLMSTFNGEKYILEQLESIRNQEDVEVSLCIRDDGSSDNTIQIINEYMEKVDFKISLLSGENVGPAESFLNLIAECNSNTMYYALSDQDDIWKSNKLIRAINKLGDYQEKALYYSSTDLVDCNGKYLETKHYHLIGKKDVFFEYVGSGCTFVYTRGLQQILSQYKPKNVYMHDTWLLTVAAFLGKLIYDDKAYILYRQHDSNVVGIHKHINLFKRLDNFFIKNKGRHSNIAKNMLKGYSILLNCDERKFLYMISNYNKTIRNKFDFISSTYINELNKNVKRSVIREIIFGTF